MKILYLSILTILLMSCNTAKKASSVTAESASIVEYADAPANMPRAIIYKTTSNYDDNVPVMLSADKKRIVSYPDPIDLRNATPIKLNDGYLLDRRGIGQNVAFTSYTYSEYAALPAPPSLQELQNRIIDTNPIKEMHVTQYPITSITVAQCNELVLNGFNNCTSTSLPMQYIIKK